MPRSGSELQGGLCRRGERGEGHLAHGLDMSCRPYASPRCSTLLFRRGPPRMCPVPMLFFVGPPRLAFQRKGPCLRRVGWCSRVGATLWTRARGWWSLRLPVGLRLRGIHCMLQHVVEFMRALQNSTHTRTLRAPNSAMPPASRPCLLCEHPRATCTLSSAPMIAHRLD